MTAIDQFVEMVNKSNNIVFFGGAGVSTESGIPDFRSTDGLYNQTYDYPPETILSHTFFTQKPEEFYRFYQDKMLALDAQPNMAHIKLAELEKAGKVRAIVTQNIDGLHQKAGSKNVLELHGSVHRNFCQKCHKFFDAQYMKKPMAFPNAMLVAASSNQMSSSMKKASTMMSSNNRFITSAMPICSSLAARVSSSTLQQVSSATTVAISSSSSINLPPIWTARQI